MGIQSVESNGTGETFMKSAKILQRQHQPHSGDMQQGVNSNFGAENLHLMPLEIQKDLQVRWLTLLLAHVTLRQILKT